MKLLRPASSAFWFLWHSLAAIGLILIPAALGALPKSALSAETSSIGMAATYWVSVITLTVYTANQPRIHFSRLTALFLSSLSCFFLLLLLTNSLYSRGFLVIALALGSAFIFLPLILKNSLQKPALFILMLALVLSLISIWASRAGQSDFIVESKIIRTNLYNLAATYYENFAVQNATGGAISTFADRYLLVLGDGQFYVLSWDPTNKQLESKKLSLRVPLNRDEFVRDVKQNGNVTTSMFRTADIVVQDFGEKFRLFASHHYWNAESQCFTVRVSAIYASYSEFVGSRESQSWETIYETTPCLRMKNKGDAFAGYQIGGQLALLDDHKLLLTVGDHKFDGVESDDILPQDQTASYGKIILINLKTHAASMYTMGHRNPQGLYVDGRGIIWSTEHGPNGGDELNIISAGKNYGWPLVTYGTDYDQPTWPLNAKQGWHDGFELPAYAWVPSIAVSAVTGIRGVLFKSWKDDLLVASLADRSLWRVRIDQQRVVFTERIVVGWRIRDLIEDQNGRLILWTERLNAAPTQSAIVIIEPVANGSELAMKGLNSARRGELLFTRCLGCHKVATGNLHGIGPDLKGILGRPIAAANGYGYSGALKRLSGNWTEEKLDAFLANPQGLAPGTSMQSEGIPDPAVRASLIEYLKSQS